MRTFSWRVRTFSWRVRTFSWCVCTFDTAMRTFVQCERTFDGRVRTSRGRVPIALYYFTSLHHVNCGRHSCHHPQSQHLPCRSASPPLTCPSRPTCSLTDHAPCSTSAAGCSTSGSTMRAASMRGKHSPQNPIRFLRGGPGWGIGRGAGTGTRDQPVDHQKAEEGSRKGGRRRGDARLSTQHLNKHRDHVACDLDTPQDANMILGARDLADWHRIFTPSHVKSCCSPQSKVQRKCQSADVYKVPMRAPRASKRSTCCLRLRVTAG